MLGRFAYRVRQVGAARRAMMSEHDRDEALSHLNPELVRLFLGMEARDQHHGLRVMRRLNGAEPLLCQAALLHDVGKSQARLGTAGRSLVVLARSTGTIGPLRRLPWLGPRVSRYLDHAQIGAEMLRSAGADAALVDIVAEHEVRQPAYHETARLQSVDERE